MSTYEEQLEAALMKTIDVAMADHEPKLSQQDVAEAVGTTRATFNRYLRGKLSMPMPMFLKVAQVVEVPADELMSRAKARLAK